MAYYIDGFVLTVPKKNMPAYKRMASKAGKIWLEHGAMEYCECVGDDMAAPFCLPFPKLTNAKPSEVVVFGWVVFENKAHRNRVGKAVMADPRLAALCDPKNLPFDMKKMAYGGFKTLVDLS